MKPGEQEMRQAGAESAAEHPRSILADGVITFSEYEGAVLQMVKCAAESGAYLTTGDPQLDARGSYLLAFEWDPEDSDLASAAVEDCGRTFLNPVQVLWSQGRARAVPESTINDARLVFWNCIENAGVDLEDRPRESSTLEYVFSQPNGLIVVTGCQERVFDEFGLGNFGG